MWFTQRFAPLAVAGAFCLMSGLQYQIFPETGNHSFLELWLLFLLAFVGLRYPRALVDIMYLLGLYNPYMVSSGKELAFLPLALYVVYRLGRFGLPVLRRRFRDAEPSRSRGRPGL